ncbi:hypothetical protein DXG01_016408 [Tephrocybe rancida]|nr:hypothetical protein DXG01_016408 [Tephrocybe rancida]
MLRTTPAVPLPHRTPVTNPTLWIAPPGPSDAPLSADVECLKWQAYLALRNVPNLLRTDVDPAGALDALPNLQTDNTTLLAAHLIPQWADQHAQPEPDYVSLEARDESRAWVALLEGTIHAALLVSQPTPSYLESLVSMRPAPPAPINALLTPPPAPLTGLTSLLPAFGARISYDAIYARYKDAIAALSDRLGTDKWFLASPEPTPLDALAFAYLHAIVVSSNATLRIEVTRRVNLVAWEWRVREQVRAAFK